MSASVVATTTIHCMLWMFETHILCMIISCKFMFSFPLMSFCSTKYSFYFPIPKCSYFLPIKIAILLNLSEKSIPILFLFEFTWNAHLCNITNYGEILFPRTKTTHWTDFAMKWNFFRFSKIFHKFHKFHKLSYLFCWFW